MSRAGRRKQKRALVTGMLAWWDEPPEMLESCVASTGAILDRLVALDGGFLFTPGATPLSPPEQAEAIRRGAKDAGIEVRVMTPRRIWLGQVEKRDWLIRTAARNSEFVMPIDADWILDGDREAVREELAERDEDCFALDMHTPIPAEPEFDMAAHAAHSWHAEVAGRIEKMNLIFRALPGIRVERHHWWYSAIKDGERIGLWGCVGLYPPCARHELAAPFQIEHMCLFRDAGRIQRNRIFCARRDLEVAQVGAEG